jgi:hypothetical protein
MVKAGLPPGYGVDDGAALHFVDDALAEVVTSRPEARAYRVEPSGETSLPVHYLG